MKKTFNAIEKRLQPDIGLTGRQFAVIKSENILPNPMQPRKRFDEVDIVSLADSIRQHGLLQPITVRKSNNFSSLHPCYEIISGERRLRALKMLGINEVRCIIIEVDAVECVQLSIIENTMRKGLDMFEFSEALASLINSYGFTQQELALRMSTSQSNIANKLRLLKFDEKQRQIILENKLTERHARNILRIESDKQKNEVLFYIIKNNLNVKQTESYVDNILATADDCDFIHREKIATDYCHQLIKSAEEVNNYGIVVSSTKYENDNEIKITLNISKTSPDDMSDECYSSDCSS